MFLNLFGADFCMWSEIMISSFTLKKTSFPKPSFSPPMRPLHYKVCQGSPESVPLISVCNSAPLPHCFSYCRCKPSLSSPSTPRFLIRTFKVLSAVVDLYSLRNFIIYYKKLCYAVYNKKQIKTKSWLEAWNFQLHPQPSRERGKASNWVNYQWPEI